MKNIVLAYKKVFSGALKFTKKSVRLPVKLKCKLKYIKTYIKASMFDGLYASSQDTYYQTRFINSKQWDFLIILDACRYDFFEKHVWKFMDGKLLRVLSPGGYTIKWFERTWYGNYKDVVYISSVPFIRRNRKFRTKFLEIVDAWDKGWDRRLHT
ncbi:MAG TPA: hypothetical protein ENG46_01140, partial [Acidilobales archaeon]|nr:hypothetical protein [Acidilobales archaeon]